MISYVLDFAAVRPISKLIRTSLAPSLLDPNPTRSRSLTRTGYPTSPKLCSVALLLILISSSKAQQLCTDNPSPGCLCFPGLTNPPLCNQLACGDPYQNATARPSFNSILSGAGGNAGCGQQCTPGFFGSNCNICRDTNACQKGISSASSSSSGPPLALSSAATGEVICSKDQIAYTANFGECNLNNPTIQALLPGKLTASIQRFPEPSSASLPSSNLAGLPVGSTTLQLLYAPNASAAVEEQFFCSASNCTQQVKDNVYSTDCKTLKCKCQPGSFLCGGGPMDLTGTINSINGDIGMDCPLDDSTTSSNSTTCHVKMEMLKNMFGPQGFALSDCQFGECVQARLAASIRARLLDGDDTSIDGGLIAGIVIAAILFLAFVGIILFGFYRQRLARKSFRNTYSATSTAAQVEWSDLKYFLPSRPGGNSTFRMQRQPCTPPPKYSSELMTPEDKNPTTSSSFSSRPAGAQILCGLNGQVKAGSMMAILGPSGAGKSTFLDVLAGQQKTGQISGKRKIFLPGESEQPVIVGFVEQSDILPATSTVREALMFSARLKLPEHVTQEERELRVSEVLELLGLSHVADSRVGDDEKRGISGGERRRLSIGLELIARPSVLFLDEPTSGLDSVSALRVVKVLKGLTPGGSEGQGTTIICSIHQPNSQIYHTFDYVCLLALGGRQIYCGPTANAISYLESHGLPCPSGFNPADFLLEVAFQPSPELLEASGESDMTKPVAVRSQSPLAFPPTSTPISKPTKPVATMITQLQVLFQREWRCLRRDPSLFWFQSAVSIVIGIFVGAMFFKVDTRISGFQNRVGSLFFTCSILVFSSLSALTNFYHVRLLFMRERAAAFYSPTAWLISRACFDVIPLRVMPIVSMGTIIYWMTGLTSTGTHFPKYLLVLTELCLVQTTFNLWLAATTRNLGKAIFCASVINLFQLGFAGFFVNLTNITKVLRWVQYIVPLKYTLEAMTVNEVAAGLMINDNIQGINVKVSVTLIMNLLFGFQEDAYWRDVIILGAFFLLFLTFLIFTVIYKLKQIK